MRCPEIKSKLMDYMADALPPSGKCAIDEHVLRCASCRMALETARNASEALSLLGAEEPAPDLVTAVRARLDREERRPAALRPRLALAAAVLVCAVVITGWFVYQPNAQREQILVRQPEKMQQPVLNPHTARPEPTVRPAPAPEPVQRVRVVVAVRPKTSSQPRREVAARPKHAQPIRKSVPTHIPGEIRPVREDPQIRIAVSPKDPESYVVHTQDQPDSPKLTVVRHFDVGGNVRSVTITNKASHTDAPKDAEPPASDSTMRPYAGPAGGLQSTSSIPGGSITDA